MPRGKPLSAAHKAAISAGLKRYYASRGGGGGQANGGRSGSPGSAKRARSGGELTPGNASKFKTIRDISTGQPISREEAARRMFGSAGGAKKAARGKKARKR